PHFTEFRRSVVTAMRRVQMQSGKAEAHAGSIALANLLTLVGGFHVKPVGEAPADEADPGRPSGAPLVCKPSLLWTCLRALVGQRINSFPFAPGRMTLCEEHEVEAQTKEEAEFLKRSLHKSFLW
ncbi:hypothetical protein DYB34_013874, partial [Aphanomyces astaci]